MTNYTIALGDNLTKIAKAHNTTVEELVKINKITNPDKIQAGQTIKVFEDIEKNQGEQKAQQVEDTSQKELAEKIETAQQQLEQMQKALDANKNDNNLEVLGYGLAGAALYKVGEKTLPYAWNGAKNVGENLYLRGLYAKDGIKNVTNTVANTGNNIVSNVGNQVTKNVKHFAKKVELEYAFGKESAKQVAKKSLTATKSAVQTAASRGGEIMTLTKAGKAVSKRLPVVGWAIAGVETYQAGKEGGVKAAIKQGSKSVSGLACGAAGAKIGAMVGACTGPAAVVAVPALTVIGGIVGYLGGEKLMDSVISWFD